MIYRTQIIVCSANSKDQMLMILKKGQSEMPKGMLKMAFTIDAHDDDKLIVLQSWDSKESFSAFQESLSSEQAAGFASVMASHAECWHNDSLTLSNVIQGRLPQK